MYLPRRKVFQLRSTRKILEICLKCSKKRVQEKNPIKPKHSKTGYPSDVDNKLQPVDCTDLLDLFFFYINLCFGKQSVVYSSFVSKGFMPDYRY